MTGSDLSDGEDLTLMVEQMKEKDTFDYDTQFGTQDAQNQKQENQAESLSAMTASISAMLRDIRKKNNTYDSEDDDDLQPNDSFNITSNADEEASVGSPE